HTRSFDRMGSLACIHRPRFISLRPGRRSAPVRCKDRSMPSTTCPSEQELQAFQLGDLPEAFLEDVAQHLEACPRCETIAQRLDATLDPILAAIRTPSAPGARSARPDYSPSSPTPIPQRSFKADAGLFPFLLPPEADDEIGRLDGYRVLRLLGK